MLDLTSENFKRYFTEMQVEAILGGSPEGMGQRYIDNYGLDIEVLNDRIAEAIDDVLMALISSEDLRETFTSETKNVTEMHAAIAKHMTHIIGTRFFLTGFAIAKEQYSNAGDREGSR